MTQSDAFMSDNVTLGEETAVIGPGRGKSLSTSVDASPHCIAFLLVPGFALLTYSCAMEPYRAANTLSGKELYRWMHISPDGRPVVASNGVSIVPDQGIESQINADDLFVCAGGNPTHFDDRGVLAWLRRQSRLSTRIGGVAGGPFILARAGLLKGYRCTMHWEYIPGFREKFPDHMVTATRFEIDRTRCTSAGGTAAFEMMVELIARRNGAELASAVCEWFLHTKLGSSQDPQRMALPARYGVTNSRLLRALEYIEHSFEDTTCRQTIASKTGVSVRQLERLFQAHLGCTINEHIQRLRLERARTLLQQTSMSVLDVAVASGFTSSAHFSRTYRKRYGHPPRAERKQL